MEFYPSGQGNTIGVRTGNRKLKLFFDIKLINKFKQKMMFKNILLRSVVLIKIAGPSTLLIVFSIVSKLFSNL